MLNRLLTTMIVLFSAFTFAQDTTWVQTFTFDSISTRRADFTFPSSLDGKRFEKVLMYYKLKCDPQTPWDQYNCGEWDYLTYTRVFDHTGVMDSNEYTHPEFLANGVDVQNVYLSYTPVYDVTSSSQDLLTINSSTGETQHTVLSGTTAMNTPFGAGDLRGRTQFILSAAEMTSSGLTAGDIQSMALDVDNAGDEVQHLRIRIKNTALATLTEYDNSAGWTDVYYHNTVLTNGANRFDFLNAFNWDGTSNVIVEMSYESMASFSGSDVNGVTGTLGESFTSQTTDRYADLDGADDFIRVPAGTIDFTNGITVQTWIYYDGMNNWSRIMDFGNGPNADNILFANPGTSSDLIFSVRQGTSGQSITANGVLQVGEWMHVAATIDASGNATIYVNGAAVETGNVHLPNAIHRTNNYIGRSNWSNDAYLDADLNEYSIWTEAVSASDIQDWMYKKIDPSHPNYSNLFAYYSFDEAANLTSSSVADASGNGNEAYRIGDIGLPLIDAQDLYMEGVQSDFRPSVDFYIGNYTTTINSTTVLDSTIAAGTTVEFYQITQNAVEPTSYDFGWEVPSGSEDQPYTNSVLTYYGVPFEVIHDVEIGRFITPYGINFDLGPNGFTWIYDVTDYQQLLNGVVDLAAHNTQELIDLKFAFIEGIPPRDVYNREPIWSDWRSYRYSDMDDDNVLQATDITLSDTSATYKIKTRFTGHGHNGSVNCCEWDSKDHAISIDGNNAFTWEIWEETACGDNPNISQGGTWPYAREGWCPGDLVKEYDHELTPLVTPGSTVTFDYDIEDVPANDQDQGNGNYIVAMDLISYGPINHQHDAAIADILNPNNWEYYKKWNPSCSNPRVMIQNTGEQPLTSCKIRIWISYGDYIDHEWTGNLEFLEKAIVEIPVTDVSWWQDYHQESTFHAMLFDVNGGDEYDQNNYMEVKFDPTEMIEAPNGLVVWFMTNNKASENKWKLMDENGNTVFERTTLTNSTNYRDTLDLAPGCYSILLEDSDSDGTGFWYSAQTEGETTGIFRLRPVGGGIVETFPSDFGNYHMYHFTIGYALGVDENDLLHEVNVFPNPNNGDFFVELSGAVNNDARLQVFDLMGREVVSQKMNANATFASSEVNMSDKPAGHYIVKVITNDSVYTKEFVKR